MFLKSIRLKNFKCYEECSYEFELGITSICGENGSGKSSILEAISWNLFNYLPYSANSKIIRNGAKSAEVELIIRSSRDKNEYLIRRKTSGVTCSVYNITKASLVAEGVNNVQTWIRHELSLGNNDNLTSICRNGIATPQGSLTLDFTESTENRKKIFDVLLGLEEFKQVQNKLADVVKLLGESSNEVKLDLARNEGLEEEIIKIGVEVKQKKQELTQKEQNLRSLKEVLEKLNTEHLEAKNNKQNSERLIQEVDLKTKESHETQQALLKCEEAEREQKSLSEQAKTYEELTSTKKLLAQQKQELEIQQNKLSQLQEVYNIETASLQRTKTELDKLQEFKQELEALSAKANNYDLLIKQERELTQQKTKLEIEINTKNKYNADLADLELETKVIKQSLQNLDSQKELATKLTDYELALEKLRAEYNEVSNLEKEHNKLQETLINKNTSLQSVLEELTSKKTFLEDEERTRSQLEAQLKLTKELMPKLSQSGVCPILLEPCLNLKAKEASVSAKTSLEEQEKEIQEKLLETSKQIIAVKKEIDELLILQETLSKLQEINNKIANRSLEVLTTQGKSLKASTEEARQADNFLKTVPNLQQQLQKLQEKIENSQKHLSLITSYEAELKDLTPTLKNLEAEIALLKPIAEKVLILRSELEKEVVFQSLVTQHEQKLKALSSDLNLIHSEVKLYIEVPEKLNNVEAELEKLQPIYIRWSALSNEVERLEALKQKSFSLAADLEKLNKELQILQAIGIKDNAWITSSEAQIQQKQNEYNKEEGLCHSLQFTLTEYEARLDELTTKQTKYLEAKKKLGKLENKEKLIAKMRAYYKELALRLAKQYTEKIGQRATNLFREIMQDGSYELTWTEDYQILTYKNGQELAFELLSGGQQTAAAISVRLGLLQELSNIRFAFFDEPTAHLDAERRNQLAMQISAIKSFDQLFVITHDESFAGQANNRIVVPS
jgi:exonuclease SbcC